MISIVHDEIPELRFPNKPPVDDAVALKNLPAGGRTVSRSAEWPASGLGTTTAHPPVPASGIAAISGMTSGGAAGPVQLLAVRQPHQPPLLAQPPDVQTKSHRVQHPALLLSTAQQRQRRLEFLRGHRSARLPRMRPTVRADVSPARRLRPARVPRIQGELLPAARVHGTTAPASTTDPHPCAAAADRLVDSRMQRPNPAGSWLISA